MSKIYNKITLHPSYNECPMFNGDNADCNNCYYCIHIGTFGGEYFVECAAMEEE